ncbi:MAG: hypothetical protein IJ438_09980 [Clostridia bacterium]|nr:hypothetical protein [Clostridia bacterium]
MLTVEQLKRCRNYALEIRALEQQLQRCLPTGKPARVRTQQYDADPPGTNDPTAAALQLYEGLLKQRDELQEAFKPLYQRCFDDITQLKDPRASVILCRYYLMGETDYEISLNQELCRSQICELRRRALKLL